MSVLRHGRLVSSRALDARDEAALVAIARDVMGGAEPPRAPTAPRRTGEVTLELRDGWRAPGLRGVTLSVRAGEIVGVAGVEGNGQRELVRVLAGLEPLDAGELRIAHGTGALGASGGVAVVHEDRHVEGLVLGASVRDNLVLGELARFTRFGVVDRRALEREARARLEARGHRPAGSRGAGAGPLGRQPAEDRRGARARSGVARGRRRLRQPTRGVDRGAARAIHDAIAGAAAEGKAVLVVSADLDELRALCDRILVLARGRVDAELPPDAPDARFGEAMLGASVQEWRRDREARPRASTPGVVP